jgi:DNA (cytosine-5)-methyltransferase 1
LLSVGGFFSGAGGLDYGLQNAGFDLTWANELETTFCTSYESLCASSITPGDFWDVQDLMPDVDVIVGGPPCQSFSLVGKRLDDDPRGHLISGFRDLIVKRRPRAFIIENVPGLAASSVDGIKLPKLLALSLENAGYTVILQKVDATEYFVPQRRKRIIIMGVLKPDHDIRLLSRMEFSRAILERTGIEFEDNAVNVRDALGDLPSPSQNGEIAVSYQGSPRTSFASLMRQNSGDGVTMHNFPTMSMLDQEFVKHIPPGGNYQNIPDSISTKRILNFKATGGRTTTYSRLHPDHPSYTVNTYFNRPNVGSNYHYREERLITVREALRLQSFPDSFTPSYRNQRELHIQVGNAVPPLMGEALGLAVRRAIGA